MNRALVIAMAGLVAVLSASAAPVAATHVLVHTGKVIVDWTIDNTFCWTLHECDGSWQFVPMSPESYVAGP